MRAAVHVDRAKRVRAADIEDVDALQLRHLDELDAVRRQELPRRAAGLAARVRLELVDLPRVVERLAPTAGTASGRPGLIGSVMPNIGVQTPFSSGVAPHRMHAAVGVARRRARRRQVRHCGRGAAPRPGSAMTSAASNKADASTVSFMSSLSASERADARRAVDQFLGGCSTRRRASRPAAAGRRQRHGARVHALLPFLARKPATVTDSPIFSVSRRQPLRCRPCGGPISAPQFVTSPVFSSFTLM